MDKATESICKRQYKECKKNCSLYVDWLHQVFNPLLDKAMLDFLKLKAFARDKLIKYKECKEKMQFVCDGQ